MDVNRSYYSPSLHREKRRVEIEFHAGQLNFIFVLFIFRWSFGVAMWEIFTLGETAVCLISNLKVFLYRRFSVPVHCE